MYGLPVEVLVLAEQHRVVAADRRAQQPGRVLRVRREDDADARRVREDRDARLAVIRRAAAQVAADRHADHHRARPVVARPVAHHRQLVANLHERRPDVVEELDLDDRLQPAQRHADGAADDVGLGERRVEHAVAAEPPLQAVRHLEDAALAGDQLASASSRLASATSSPKTTMRGLRAISSFERGVDGAHHRVRRRRAGRGSVANADEVGSTSGEKTKIAPPCPDPASAPAAPRRPPGSPRARRDARMSAKSSSVASPSALRNCRIRSSGSRRASASRSAGVLYSFSSSDSECEYGPNDRGVHERRPLARAHVRDRLAQRAVAGEVVGAVAAEHAQAGNAFDDARDVAAGRLHFDRHRDGVAVVLDQEEHRQLARARRVERFPELAFAGRAVADRDVGDLVGVIAPPRDRESARRGA